MIKSVRLRIALPAIFLTAALLAACGSAPPAPSDRFYRLQVSAPPLAKTVGVRSVRADSLYAERPIVFTHADDSRQLRQYHYHLWLYPPARMVQDHLQAALGGTAVRDAVRFIDVRITHFERVLDDRHGRALAGLEVAFSDARGMQDVRHYRAEVAAADGSWPAFAAAMETALGEIYRQLAHTIDTQAEAR